MHADQHSPYYNASRCAWWRCGTLVHPNERRCWEHRGLSLCLLVAEWVTLPWGVWSAVNLLGLATGWWPELWPYNQIGGPR